VKYTVAPGDTLSRIAANHYGRATTANVNAIVGANRSTIKNPDVLHTGAVIVIPTLKGATGTPVESVTSKKKSAEPATSPSDARRAASFTWYQIRPNDRYISIAREQLGDASRWEEIHAMNRTKFPDPGKIRVGVRIKLPVDRSASAGGRH
jgi:nucleoid-associated protein YgaU